MVGPREEYIPYEGVVFDNENRLDRIPNTLDNSYIGCFVEIDLKYVDEFKH